MVPRLDSARRASRKAGEGPAARTGSEGGEIFFAPPAVGGPVRRYEAAIWGPGRAGTQRGADERDAEAGQRPEDVQGGRREADDLEPCDVEKLKKSNQVRF